MFSKMRRLRFGRDSIFFYKANREMLYPRSILKHSVRFNEIRENQVRHYNSPSQASDPVDKEDSFYDYRKAFKESPYNVRHSDHPMVKDDMTKVSFLPIGLTKAEYLVSQGILKEEEKTDTTAYNAACAEYTEVTGFAMDKSYHRKIFSPRIKKVVEGVDHPNHERWNWFPEDLEGKRARMRGLIVASANARGIFFLTEEKLT